MAKATDPDLCKQFLRAVNMTPAEIRAWSKDPRSRCYSQKATHDRLTKRHRYRGPRRKAARKTLPPLATLRGRVAKRCPTDTATREYMAAVVNFVARHRAQAAKRCTPGRAVALRNWGHRRCALPKTCSRSKRTR